LTGKSLAIIMHKISENLLHSWIKVGIMKIKSFKISRQIFAAGRIFGTYNFQTPRKKKHFFLISLIVVCTV